MMAFFGAYESVINEAMLLALMGLAMWIWLRAGLLSLAGPGFLAVGAYSSAWIMDRWSLGFFLAVVLAAAVSASVAVLSGKVLLRTRGLHFAIITLAFSELVRLTALNWTSVTGGALGLSLPRLTASWHLLVALGLVGGTVAFTRKRWIDLWVDATAVDELMARVHGVDASVLRLSIYTAGAAVFGITGALGAHLDYFIAPSDYGFDELIDMLAVVVLGGTYHWGGTVVAAGVFAGFRNVLRRTLTSSAVDLGAYLLVILGLAIAIIAVRWPGGLSGWVKARRILRSSDAEVDAT